MDMKSYDLKRYPDFLLVPYRPVSGNLAKDLKNSFVFTFDCLQVRIFVRDYTMQNLMWFFFSSYFNTFKQECYDQ